jgi:hypothetical protein
MEKTNFDIYLEVQLNDPEFVERFERADTIWSAGPEDTSSAETGQLDV